MTEIYLIRHGQAEGNVFRRIHGQYDSLLTPTGILQAKCVEKRFQDIRIDGCFSSDLTRTSLTARSIYVPKNLRLRRDPRFREVNLGVWEDLPFGYLDAFQPERMHAFNHNPPKWNVTGGETYPEYTSRFIEGMVDAAKEFDGGTVAIFGHGAVIRGTLMRLFFDDDCDKLPYCDNTGVCKLIYDRGRFSYEFVNDNSHIPHELSTFATQSWWRKTGDRSEVNLYYVPYADSLELPADLPLPEMDSRGVTLAAILGQKAVALISMAAPEGDLGRILGMSLRADLEGRDYGEQLLGAAFSHFRHLGCKSIAVNPGYYPDDIVRKYEFDLVTNARNIDPKIYQWG